MCVFFFFKQKTAYEMRISDWSSDVCSSDLIRAAPRRGPSPASGSRRGGGRVRGRFRTSGRDGTLAGSRRLSRLVALRVPAAAASRQGAARRSGDRKSVVEGKSVSVRVDLGGRRIMKKTKRQYKLSTE